MANLQLPWLTNELVFPDTSQALKDPNGLLAAGGDLSIRRLLLAYRNGIFPWYGDNEPILWWSPDPRAVIFPGQLHISKSLQKTLNKKKFTVTFNQAFIEVVEACRLPRKNQPRTWITAEMKQAYEDLYKIGYAHSIECWQDDQLVGGMYGVILGKCFFGESMFSTATDASKVVMVELDRHLQKNHFALLDCQVSSAHTLSMGAVEIPRTQFLELLHRYG
jgi:leucyl/phenylalanyl-tRNA---protein transferase